MQSAPRKVSSTCASRSSEPGLRTCPLPKHSVALLEVHLKWCASPLVCVSVPPVPAIPSPRVKYRTSFRVQREKIWLALNELVRFICATTLGPRTRTHGATHARRAPATAPPRRLAPLGAVAHRCRANVASSRTHPAASLLRPLPLEPDTTRRSGQSMGRMRTFAVAAHDADLAVRAEVDDAGTDRARVAICLARSTLRALGCGRCTNLAAATHGTAGISAGRLANQRSTQQGAPVERWLIIAGTIRAPV